MMWYGRMNLNNTNVIFPILIQKYKYDKHKEFKEFITDFIKYKNKSFNGDWNNVTTIFQKDNNQKALSSFMQQPEKQIKDFKKFCEDSCFNYVSEILQYDIEKMLIVESWINIYDHTSSIQKAHYHANSFICGNYFLNYNEQEHSPLCFLNPLNSVNQHVSPVFKVNKKNKLNSLNASESHISCDEGTIVFWPSYLYHFVPPSKSIGRSTIAMNLLPNKIINQTYGFEINPLS